MRRQIMNRSLKVERVFPLGEYKMLRLEDEINDLPESLMLRQEVVDCFRTLQLVQVELTHKKYLALSKKMSAFDKLETMIEFLENEREETLKEITRLIKNGKIEEPKLDPITEQETIE
jgi:hypothetical protein